MESKQLTFGSLFAGIGGFDLGLERAGLRCAWQVEKDEYCRRVLARRFPGVKQYGAIEETGAANLEWVEVLCGGFPCQDLSLAGKRAGIVKGSRSNLWFEYARLIGEIRPRYVLIENVAGLLVRDSMLRVLGELSKLGYVGVWRSLRASEFGASHQRKRVFIIAWNLAYCEGGGWGELRQSSGSDGFTDRNDKAMDNATSARCERGENSGAIGKTQTENRGRSEKLSGRGFILADSSRGQREQSRRREPDKGNVGRNGISGSYGCGASMGEKSISYSDSSRLQDSEQEEPEGEREQQTRTTEQLHRAPMGSWSDGDGGRIPTTREGIGCFAPGPNSESWRAILKRYPDLSPTLKSPIRGVANGFPDWLDRAMKHRTKRLSRLGNAIVPQVAQWLGERVIEFDRQMKGRF